MNIDFPYHMNNLGRTAATDENDHIRDLIEQVLFTVPGERVNRPTFGSGLLQLIFARNSSELIATLQFTLQAALQNWLGNRIQVESVQITNQDSTLQVLVQYVVLRNQQRQVAQFRHSV